MFQGFTELRIPRNVCYVHICDGNIEFSNKNPSDADGTTVDAWIAIWLTSIINIFNINILSELTTK